MIVMVIFTLFVGWDLEFQGSSRCLSPSPRKKRYVALNKRTSHINAQLKYVTQDNIFETPCIPLASCY